MKKTNIVAMYSGLIVAAVWIVAVVLTFDYRHNQHQIELVTCNRMERFGLVVIDQQETLTKAFSWKDGRVEFLSSDSRFDNMLELFDDTECRFDALGSPFEVTFKKLNGSRSKVVLSMKMTSFDHSSQKEILKEFQFDIEGHSSP